MTNSRWQANKIGLINFWYYDDQEFPFVKGRMLLRGSNGSGKSVTMQSVVPLLLDGNMSPERLDPFGSRDRKMSSYLLEEDDGREERTGYLYLEFKRKDSDIYITIGIGIRARRGKNLDKWYFSLTDGRRMGKDFFLYKDIGEKVTLSKKELENRIGVGGRVIDKQADYMDYVNRQIFGFETVEEYKEMIDLLIQLRTPKLSKDFKPSIINEILSDSLQPLSDDDLSPMSEAIENMDAMNMNLENRKDARQAAEKIHVVFSKYNRKLLYEKADRYEQALLKLQNARTQQKEQQDRLEECRQKIIKLKEEHQRLDAKRESMEKERESLNKSDAVALKRREVELATELVVQQKNLKEKMRFLDLKQEQYQDTRNQIKAEEERKYEKEKELKELIEVMQDEADAMSFEEHTFMKSELEKEPAKPYKFEFHRKQFNQIKEKIDEGAEILAETDYLERQKDDLIKEREQQIRKQDASQRKISELGTVFVQAQNEWKEALYQWNGSNQELVLENTLMREMSAYADSYEEESDFTEIRRKVADVWIEKNTIIESEISTNHIEIQNKKQELNEIKIELIEWENQKDPQPERSEAVVRNRQKLDEMGIPYQEFYKVMEFGDRLSEEACNHLEEALLKMGILDALVIDERYKEQVLSIGKGHEDHYLFKCQEAPKKNLLNILELNEEVNDIFSNQRLTGILESISYDDESVIAISENGTYRMGVLVGTVSGEHEAGFLGTQARERYRLAKIEECRLKISEIEETLRQLETIHRKLEEKKDKLKREYEAIPKDIDMREALQMVLAEEREYEQLKRESEKLEEQIHELVEVLKEKKKSALEIAQAVYLTCSYVVFKDAKLAAEEYAKHLIELIAAHEMLIQRLEYLRERKERLENLDDDMEQIRYDIAEIQKEIKRKSEEQASIQEQLRLTDYEEIKERLDRCIEWLQAYPEQLRICVSSQTHEEDEALQLTALLEHSKVKIEEYEKKSEYFSKCYEAERALEYVELPKEIMQNAGNVRDYLEVDAKALDKDTVVRDLNKVYYENKGFLTDYHMVQSELFAEDEYMEFSPKRLDLSARYQGVNVSFSSLLNYLDEDIRELENLIKDGDRELFEDILANTVSRKIRGKINASNTWVQKMNLLMNGMNTSSGLKLSLRWRSKTADQEEQLDTKDLVELLKKDYRLMSEEEAAALSAHFRSKVAEARRNAKDSAGMISFSQIMKDTLDYRKWFEFQLFSQKSGERSKELTNSVFGTFSGGEKAMSMYVPLFSAVVAKYQGGREDAPRIISLDEAFAGVDNKNIRDMFRLMTEFQFDFIINSQVLWGDCDTLDALAIYQLIRPENAKFVAVMPYLWNGYNKELLESEANVERRGIEIG